MAISTRSEEEVLRRLSKLSDDIFDGADELENAMNHIPCEDIFKKSAYMRDEILPRMESLRKAVDNAEVITAKEYWPYPDYGDILYSVK